MELSTKLKPSEVGPISPDWDLVPIRELLEKNARITYGVVQPGKEDPDGVPFVRGGDIFDGSISQNTLRTISKSVSNQYKRTQLLGGELLISLVGYPGECALAPNHLQGANIARQVALVRFQAQGNFDPVFVCHFLRSTLGKKLLLKEAFGSAQQVINLRDVNRLVLPLPRQLEEQRAIATALSDVDALIAGLERLIAKKRDIKQAAMQQLLTGQTRLPGFSGSWRRTTFGNVVRHHSGNSELIKGKLPSSDAAGHYPGFSASGQDVWLDRYEHEGDAIVVSAVGSRCGKAFAASGKWSAIANTHVVWPDEKQIDRRFLGFFINDEDFWLKSGSGQPFVLFKQTFARQLQLPSLDEQKSISTILFDIDHDLAVAESRLAKTRAIKQGMTQELLTGRTRLLEAK